ncbi:MAG: OsmC family protein [Acidimicrobiales bacterium]
MTATVRVIHIEGDQFEIAIRQHRLLVDQPVADGGNDSAPTPTELFISSLAACIAHYARRYLARHNLPTAGLSVDAEYAMVAHPTRVGEITLYLAVPDGLPDDRLAGLLAVARKCTVHNTLEVPPAVLVELAREPIVVA